MLLAIDEDWHDLGEPVVVPEESRSQSAIAIAPLRASRSRHVAIYLVDKSRNAAAVERLMGCRN